ncbi:SIMPL domain-containing protein [Sediminitomix flava]|uniref:Uncharacterized protein DUF541 n=1 Tax=Sediminitomix flava TaxID=379075 RepID=A0A315Z9N1_SEDFL|nr:SIMPL domain-containing protein [Sediminitomix flava]PWJ41763.1 uncharacterized protein DUF541 [Sediminitomix flava]
MKFSFLISCISFFLISLQLSAQETTLQLASQNYIEVMGESKIELEPNQIFINIRFKNYMAKVNKDVSLEKALFEQLNELKIDLTKQLEIRYDPNHLNANSKLMSSENTAKVELTQLRKNYIVQLGSAVEAEQLINSLKKNKDIVFELERIDHTNLESFKSKVQQEAIKEAKAKAEELTSAIGQSIRKASLIREIESATSSEPSKNVFISAQYPNGIDHTPEKSFQKIILEAKYLVRFDLHWN